MRALSSHFVLVDLQNSWHSANQIPTSTLCYLQNSNFISTVSSSFRRKSRAHKPIASSKSSSPSIPSPEIRRPSDRFFSGNGSLSNSPNSNSASTSEPQAASELEMLLELLPMRMKSELYGQEEIGELIEVVMDLGRSPIARFPSGDWVISEKPVNHEDLRHAVSKVSEFSDDNRSGINNSLHRISAIRNRKLQIIGLTCRVGRAVSGSAEVIRDLVEGGGSILVIGPPGVGKTTLIREIARMLADDQMKRVVIVDTSNEIGGDGDVPHAGIGRARRMQVPNVNMQHNVMIEAVENHMPETIIIDEIGTELEALAASTIAQRGVQLVGTAHGMTIDNIMKNPSLQILVGGIEVQCNIFFCHSVFVYVGYIVIIRMQSVTLGDEEARKRKVQKTILERKGPPTFTCAVEIISKTEYRVHHRLDATVDAILAGKTPLFEVRRIDAEANDSRKSIPLPEKNCLKISDFTVNEDIDASADIESDREHLDHSPNWSKNHSKRPGSNISLKKQRLPVCIYTYKILEADLLQVAKVMGLEDEIEVTDDIGTADAIIASSSEMKQNPWIRGVAKFHQLPVFVMKSNTMAQMVKAVRMILEMESVGSLPKQLVKNPFDIEIEDDAPKRKPSLEEIDALEEVRLAIEYIVIPGGEPVELLPRRSEIIARQLELVASYQLAAENSGTEMNPRLQILPMRLNKKKSSSKAAKSSSSFLKVINSKSVTGGGGGTSVTRLPLLSDQ
ncbi:PREDICTED: single-stranded [Prunus dulcis]|uniref:PREDICTED: single-stranded n=1 Tax=Prunus dulcis TaxID=3755 RepID=A0A5E4EA20_PRUDU|nr:PREDICTED: single-stranded [Prunus dulcis]